MSKALSTASTPGGRGVPSKARGENGLPKREYYGDEWKKFHAQGAYKKFEAGFDDHRAYARRADQIVRRELGSRLDLLARSVKADGPRIVVYNGLPWKRSGMVEIPGRPGHFLFAEDVPANGYKTYAPGNETSTSGGVSAATLDTAVLQGRVRSRARRHRVVDRETNRPRTGGQIEPLRIGTVSPRTVSMPSGCTSS